MTTIKTQQEYAAFLESLKVKNEGLEEMHGWRFDMPLQRIEEKCYSGPDFIQYLIERCRRAESNAKPSDLVEKVKACMRVSMDAEREFHESEFNDTPVKETMLLSERRRELRKLTEAE